MPTSPARTAAAADAASFYPAPAEGWAYNAGPEGGYVRSPATARGGGFGGDGGGGDGDGGRFGGDGGDGGFGGDGGGAEEASAVLSAEHGHFAMAAMSAEAPPVELHSDRPLANGHAPSHRAVAADGSVHVAVAGGSVDAWLSKASDMEISRRRSFGADGEPLPA